MRFENKVVLISGGTRGIGAATAKAFASEGARVILNYRSNDEAAQATLKALEGKEHKAIACDIGNPAAIADMVDEVVTGYGQIDILVNNAAVHEVHPIDTVNYASWQKEWKDTIGINLIGTANLTYCVAQHMITARSGQIIFVSSRGAFRGEPDQPAYGASKAGINALAQSLAQKLAPYNITTGVVAPGFVETDLVSDILQSERGLAIQKQSPFNRVARPEEVAHAIMFFADPRSLWSSGAILDVNGASYLRT